MNFEGQAHTKPTLNITLAASHRKLHYINSVPRVNRVNQGLSIGNAHRVTTVNSLSVKGPFSWPDAELVIDLPRVPESMFAYRHSRVRYRQIAMRMLRGALAKQLKEATSPR